MERAGMALCACLGSSAWRAEPCRIRLWHKADVRQPTTNVRFRGKADIAQTLLISFNL
jgi:hypothetical protein